MQFYASFSNAGRGNHVRPNPELPPSYHLNGLREKWNIVQWLNQSKFVVTFLEIVDSASLM